MLLLDAARARAETRRELGRKLAATTSEAEARATVAHALRDAFDGETIVYLADEGRLVNADAAAAHRVDPSLDATAGGCWEAAAAGHTEVVTDSSRAWACWPLIATGEALGVLALRLPADEVLSVEGAALAEAIVADLAQALARLRLARALEQARMQAESERLRAALLSSVSHDLRSPLSTIIGSAESLELYRDRLAPADQTALAHDIAQEGRRLDRYIQNLLDMARLEQNADFAREWIGVDEIVGAAVRRLVKAYPAQRFDLESLQSLPLVRVNAPLFEQALFNVLDNAARHSPDDSPVSIRAHAGDGVVHVEVSDRGPGIPETERDRVFEMFHRVERGDRQSEAGTGLGLAICRGILRAHGGEAAALDPGADAGTTIQLTLPLEPLPAAPAQDD
jgi:two-component system sensor histidine kinase KdpD